MVLGIMMFTKKNYEVDMMLALYHGRADEPSTWATAKAEGSPKGLNGYVSWVKANLWY